LSANSSIALDIHQRLHETRLHHYRTDAKAKALSFGALLIVSLSILSLLELLFHFNAALRTIVFFGLVAVIAVFGTWLVLRPLFRIAGILSVDDDTLIARRIGNYFPAIRDGLTNFLQLQQETLKGRSLYSMELLEASFADFAGLVRTIDFKHAVDESDIVRTRKWFVGSTVGAIVLFLAFPISIPASLSRLAHFNTEFTTPPKYAFNVRPGNKEVIKGEQVEIGVRLSSMDELVFRPASLDLFSRMEGQDRFDQMSIRPDSTGIYHGVLQNVKVSTEYFVRASDVYSQHFVLKVLDRPIIRSLKVRLVFPAYSRIPERLQDEFAGDVTALEGTRVFLSGLTSKELSDAMIVFGRDSLSTLSIGGNKFSGSFLLKEDGSYHIEITDRDSLINYDPVRYNLKVIPDEWPTAAIVAPGRNMDIVGDQSLQLLVHAEDDFGFTRMRLGYRLIHSRYQGAQAEYSYLSIPLPSGQQTKVEVPFAWNLSKMDLVPEDVVEYFAEVFDNDAVKGPKSTKSNLYLLRLPSLQEIFSDVNKGHEQSLDEIKQAMEDAKQLRDEVESVNTDIKKNKNIDWQQQKKMEEMAKKYQEIQKKLQNVGQQLDEMVQKMDQQKVLSKETMEKYMELQQLFQELNSSELQQALKQMQQAVQNVSKEQLQQAMRQVTFSEEQFRQGIERTMELLKRIQIEQKVDEVKKRAQELEQLQNQLRDESSKALNDKEKQQETAAKQENLALKEQEMEKASADLAKRMEEFFTEMPLDKLNALNQQLQQKNLGQQMKDAGQQMRQGNMQQAQQTQQETQEGLKNFSEQMDALQQEMLQRQAQHVVNELRKATNNMLTLSEREEALKQQSKSAAPNSPQLRQNAEGQLQVMQDLNNVTKGLSELSKKSFAVTPAMGKAIGEAMAKMQNAMKDLDTRNGQLASQDQDMAMASLNEGAVQIQNALQAMMQGGQGGPGGLLQQLQMLAGSQMSLNLRSEQLGQGMTTQQAAEAARLAQQQDAIRKSLDQLNQEAKDSQEQQRLLGDLDKIGEEMKEVVSNLQQNNVSRETIQKQERILSRLLDASKSMHERDYEKKRTSKAGTEIVRKSPDELNPSDLNATNRLREDMLKALQQGYSKDYQELIRKYFEELQKAEKVKE
jgi:hypothetical protein